MSLELQNQEHAQNQQELITLTTQLHNIYYQLKEKMQSLLDDHIDQINTSEHFRTQFFSLCTSIGIDPLQSSQGMEKLSDFYYKLSTRLLTSFVEFEAITDTAARLKVSPDDVEKTIQQLKVFGSVEVFEVNGRKILTRESNSGTQLVLQLSQKMGKKIFKQSEMEHNGITKDLIYYLLQQGVFGIDCQCENGQFDPDYYLLI